MSNSRSNSGNKVAGDAPEMPRKSTSHTERVNGSGCALTQEALLAGYRLLWPRQVESLLGCIDVKTLAASGVQSL